MNPEIVLGPPGTGKTTNLLDEVETELARGVAPDRVGYISFTRKAAEEAKTRAMIKFTLASRQLPWFRTIHSLCFAALGLSSSEVFEGKRVKEFGEWAGVRTSGFVSMEEGGTFGFDDGDRCLFMDNLARVRGIPLREQYGMDDDGLPWNVVEKVSRALEEYKRTKGLMDFTDMLQEFVRTSWAARLEVLFVDEVQDLSMLQWQVVEKLAQGARRVVVAGDDDQAIYRWAGAAVEHFIGLPGSVRVLGHSWRVPPYVQDTALRVLKIIPADRRREKKWEARDGDSGVVSRKDLSTINMGDGVDTLVLARNTCFLRDDVMPRLRKEGIIYGFRGGMSVKQSVVDAILDWEKLRRGEQISVAQAERVYDNMSSRVGYKHGQKKLPNFKDRDAMVSMRDLRENGGLLVDMIWHEALSRIPTEEVAYMLTALHRGEKLRKPTVRLSTIHGAKGGEADRVILLPDLAWRTMREAELNPYDEARVFYVAATRAKRELTIVVPNNSKRSYNLI